MERWVRVLEDLVRVPFTRIRFGLDVILGIVPVIGDFAGLICGIPLLVSAFRRRLPVAVVAMMSLNVLLDAVLGSIPLAGDIFDLAWKSHRKNLRLLQNPASLPEVLQEARWKLGAMLGIVALLVVLLVGLLIAAVRLWLWFLQWSWTAQP